MNSYERTQVAFRVFIRIVEAGEAATWIILDWSNIFQICRIFTFARHPNCVQLKSRNSHEKFKRFNRQTHGKWLTDAGVADEVLKILWHGMWQAGTLIVVMRNPSEDFVQLKENARCASVVVVVIFLDTRSPRLDVDIADLPSRGLLPVVAVVNVLTTSRNRARCLICCE